MLVEQLRALNPRDEIYASQFVDALLQAAERAHVSDIHLQPLRDGLDLRWRLDGVLQPLGRFPRGESSDVVVRLKVLAGLLTYRTDVPQEGRIRQEGRLETRVSTFPTLFGERAVVRLFPAADQLQLPADLGLPDDLGPRLIEALRETSGAVIISGPAGSGKTTTIYACLRELVRQSQGGRAIVTLEDPVEVVVEGVAQAQIERGGEFDFALGVRSILRQDPEVLMIGEIRDAATAEAAFAASLTGHLVLTTFHAGNCSTALARLADMGLEPYLIRSGTRAILAQRLLRRLCNCAGTAARPEEQLGLPVSRSLVAEGCAACQHTGYQGRLLTAEMVTLQDGPLADAVLVRADAAQLQRIACELGLITHWQRACQLVEEGRTSAAEVRRVFGFSQ